jgi:predicted metal-dependent enzyme (double-stranded beta helix superfamily)
VAYYSGVNFADDIAVAMEKSEEEARRLTEEAVRRAVASPRLLEGYEEEMATQLEFHLLQTPTAAIKVFALKAEHGLGVPHDHAGLWGCYGTHTGRYLMETYRPADPEGVCISPLERRLMEPGEIRFMETDAIHRVWAEEPSLVLTVYNGDLNALPRRIWDLDGDRVIRDRSRWDERMVDGKVLLDLDG